MSPNDRTGRTSRMVEYAVRMSQRGHKVYVCVLTKAQAAGLDVMRSQLDPKSTSICFDTVAGLGDIDWEQMRLRGAHSNCVLLVDHAVIEQRFAKAIEMMHKFDRPLTIKE